MASGGGHKAKTRYLFIDALRGIAALLVVLFHAYEGGHISALTPALPTPVLWLFQNGSVGVYIFFVISGFVIANTLVPQAVTARGAGIFMLRRSIRLDPPYWASMLLVVAFAALSSKVVGGAFTPPSGRDVLLHVLYLPGLMQAHFIADVYWTLCLEIQFYLTFALLMVIVTRASAFVAKERALDLVLWPSALLANLWALEVAPFQVPGLFTSHWYMFLAGVLVWRAVNRAPAGDYVPTYAAAIDLLVLGGATLHFDSVALGVGTVTAATVLVGGLSGKLYTWLSARPFQFLGAISYSLYLIHSPLTGAGFRVIYMGTGRGTALLELLALLVVIGGCVLGAFVFYKIIEAPSMALAKRIGAAREDQAPPASSDGVIVDIKPHNSAT